MVGDDIRDIVWTSERSIYNDTLHEFTTCEIHRTHNTKRWRVGAQSRSSTTSIAPCVLRRAHSFRHAWMTGCWTSWRSWTLQHAPTRVCVVGILGIASTTMKSCADCVQRPSVWTAVARLAQASLIDAINWSRSERRSAGLHCSPMRLFVANIESPLRC